MIAQPIHGELEEHIDQVMDFVRAGRPGSFPFFFIDPTGWTSFGMHAIKRLLKQDPGEVLINFMTGHIERFIETENSRQGFIDLFGDASFQQRLAGLKGQDREDAIVDTYCANVRKTGGFAYTCPAIVLRTESDRTHFHLIYATRTPRAITRVSRCSARSRSGPWGLWKRGAQPRSVASKRPVAA